MYPNLYYAFKDLFGVEMFFLQRVHTAGFFMAIAFVAGGWLWERELRRMQAAGLFWYREKRRGGTEKEWPADLTPGVTALAAVTALAGARLFGILENPGPFFNDPLKTLFSPSGFAFYGGLIVTFVVMWWYHRYWGWQRLRIVDALTAPIMLSYALGRIGCHISGDGDWGIPNHHARPFSWIPDWLWAYRYPHNVIKEGIYMPGCDWGEYCYRLPIGVFPTPLYEFAGGMLFFGILWYLRLRIKTAGRLAALYLLMMGGGRLLVEQIRVNTRYHAWGTAFTQAELISLLLILSGIVMYVAAPRFRINTDPATTPGPEGRKPQ